MKFPVNKCIGCGLDLTTAKPAKVKGPGETSSAGLCPQCSAPYFLIENWATQLDVVSAPSLEPPVAETVTEKPKGKGKGKAEPKPEPEAPSEPAEPEPEV